MGKKDRSRIQAKCKFRSECYSKRYKKQKKKRNFSVEKQYRNNKDNIIEINTNPACPIRNRIPCIICNVAYEEVSLYKRHMEEVHQGREFPYSRDSPIRIESLPEELIQKQEYYEEFFQGVGIAGSQRDSPYHTPVIGRTFQVQKFMPNIESSVEILVKLQKKRKDK